MISGSAQFDLQAAASPHKAPGTRRYIWFFAPIILILLGIAVYALREARPPHAPGIEKPNVVDAALLLRRNAYRPLLVQRMDQKANYFHAAATIANAVGVFVLTRALDFARMPDVIATLEQHWLDLRLEEAAA